MRTTPQTSRSSGPHPEEIKAAIRKRGTTLADLSREHGYSESAAGIALHRPWPALEQIIADYLGTTPQELWPERYDADGKPLRARPLRRTGRAARGLRRLK